MPNDELVGNKTDLAEQRALVGMREKKNKESLWPLEKGQVTKEDDKHVVRLYREKISRAKAQLELYLSAAIKDNKKMFL